MQSREGIKILWVVLLPISLWASVEQEVLILFKSETIQMPNGKDTASLQEVIAPQEVISCFEEIQIQEISRVVPDFNRADTMKITEDGTIARLLDFSQLFLLKLAIEINRDSVIVNLETLDDVISVEKNQPIEFRITDVNDTYFDEFQWNLNDPSGQYDINVMKAWDLSRGSSSIKLGIVDTGVDSLHPDLRGRVTLDGEQPFLNPANHPDNYHGTYVAGIAGAMTNNNKGIAGVDWYAKIHSTRIAGTNVSAAINAVINSVNAGCRVINCSWALPSWSDLLYQTFLWVYQCNVLPVAAVKEWYNYWEYPESFGPWMCNVAGTAYDEENVRDKPYPYFIEVPWVDVSAPAGDDRYYYGIKSTWFDGHWYGHGSYRSAYGTSAAAPHVTGLAGLLLGANSGLKNYELEWIMKLSAEDIAPTGVDDTTGYGIIDAYEAVRHVILPYELSRGNVSLTIYDPVYRNFTYPILPYILPAGYYMCKMVVADIMLNFLDYAETPWGFLSLTGFSPDQPNDGRYWMRQNINPYGAHLTTCFYYLYARWVSGNWVPVNKWVPVDPSVIPSQYTIIGRNLINRPTDLAATALANGNIRLSWSDNSHNELKFLIERRVGGGPFALYDSVGQNIHTYADDNVTIGIRYGYQVYAKAQEFTSSYSNAAYATAGLAAPSNLAIINQPTPTSVKLQWTDNSLIETMFWIARKVDGGDWNEYYADTFANITNYIDTVSFLHKYNYRVRAYDNQSNYSEWSNTIEFMSGVLAQSTYSEMSAFNATCKIAAGQNNMLHILADDDEFGHRIRYCISTDGGVNFGVWEEVTECDTNAALSLDANGIPWVVAAVYDRPM
ncbi:S8 family serine peptidase [candidate division WOR-3 bacterium]|nr:S8 family serine peptidase [candidate division WOR-3 bacterium]